MWTLEPDAQKDAVKKWMDEFGQIKPKKSYRQLKAKAPSEDKAQLHMKLKTARQLWRKMKRAGESLSRSE